MAERWLSGLRHTPGKRAWLKPTEGSNPSLSASFLFRIEVVMAAQCPVLPCIASTVSRGAAVQDVTHGLHQLLRMIRLLQKCGCFAQSETGPFRIQAITAGVNDL